MTPEYTPSPQIITQYTNIISLWHELFFFFFLLRFPQGGGGGKIPIPFSLNPFSFSFLSP